MIAAPLLDMFGLSRSLRLDHVRAICVNPLRVQFCVLKLRSTCTPGTSAWEVPAHHGMGGRPNLGLPQKRADDGGLVTQQPPEREDSGRGLVAFIPGTWMHDSSWEPWQSLFDRNGYDSLVIASAGRAGITQGADVRKNRARGITFKRPPLTPGGAERMGLDSTIDRARVGGHARPSAPRLLGPRERRDRAVPSTRRLG